MTWKKKRQKRLCNAVCSLNVFLLCFQLAFIIFLKLIYILLHSIKLIVIWSKVKVWVCREWGSVDRAKLQRQFFVREHTFWGLLEPFLNFHGPNLQSLGGPPPAGPAHTRGGEGGGGGGGPRGSLRFKTCFSLGLGRSGRPGDGSRPAPGPGCWYNLTKMEFQPSLVVVNEGENNERDVLGRGSPPPPYTCFISEECSFRLSHSLKICSNSDEPVTVPIFILELPVHPEESILYTLTLKVRNLLIRLSWSQMVVSQWQCTAHNNKMDFYFCRLRTKRDGMIRGWGWAPRAARSWSRGWSRRTSCRRWRLTPPGTWTRGPGWRPAGQLLASFSAWRIGKLSTRWECKLMVVLSCTSENWPSTKNVLDIWYDNYIKLMWLFCMCCTCTCVQMWLLKFSRFNKFWGFATRGCTFSCSIFPP